MSSKILFPSGCEMAKGYLAGQLHQTANASPGKTFTRCGGLFAVFFCSWPFFLIGLAIYFIESREWSIKMDQTSISVSDSLRVYDNILQAIGHTPLIQLNNQRVLDPVMHDHVILVAESDRPVGILTKIDILDFIAQGE